MPSPFRRSLPIAGVAVLVTAALALAETPAAPAPHVRPESAALAALLDQLLARSATARALVDRLDRSDVVVYVRHRAFTETTLDGRTGFVHSEKPTRYLIVELACTRPLIDQLTTLGHELQHAVEIAEAAGVDGPRRLAAYFSRIGVRTSTTYDAVTFETERAREVSMLVRRELSTGNVRSTHERE